MSNLPIKRALISVSDKRGLIPFARQLHELGIELISTGGTSTLLRAENIPVRDVADITGFPEIMDGRVKTLHPKIHGGILGKRDAHADIAKTHQIPWIDLVIVNLYPFAKTIQNPGVHLEEAIENIDIGGPTMIRSAAKNMAFVTVIVDPNDYETFIMQLKENNDVPFSKRQILAQKAFAHTAQYDALIQEYLAKINHKDSDFPEQISLTLTKENDLRYGENPHQRACAYRLNQEAHSILDAAQHQGKALSYNNITDANAAMSCVREFSQPACVIVKHANPCGVATAPCVFESFTKALEADNTSAFGGIIAFNQACDEKTAAAIASSFFEVVIAPSFSEKALQHFANKPNLRVLSLPVMNEGYKRHYQFVDGLVLLQDSDNSRLQSNQLQAATKEAPSAEEIENLIFAWNVVKHVKSNAIVVAKDHQTVGIGPGQVSRVDAVEIAIRKAGIKAHGAALASDAFFPFKDSIDLIAKAGIRSIIQPGGSIRDTEVIQACNEHGIAMVFTGIRCFKH